MPVTSSSSSFSDAAFSSTRLERSRYDFTRHNRRGQSSAVSRRYARHEYGGGPSSHYKRAAYDSDEDTDGDADDDSDLDSPSSRTTTFCCCVEVSSSSSLPPSPTAKGHRFKTRRSLGTMLLIVLALAVSALVAYSAVLGISSKQDAENSASSILDKEELLVEIIHHAEIHRPKVRHEKTPKEPYTRQGREQTSQTRSIRTTDGAFVHTLAKSIKHSDMYKDFKHEFVSRVELCNEWAKDDILKATAYQKEKAILLPYSADFFSAISIFPNAETYVFFHSAKSGARTETADDCHDEDSSCFMDARRTGIDALAVLSDRHHASDYTSASSYVSDEFGVLPMLIASIVASGRTIEEYAVHHPTGLVPGFRMVIGNPAKNNEKSTLFYVTAESSRRHKALYSFLNTKAPFQTLILPGQYDLHKSSRRDGKSAPDTMNAIVLSISKLIIQDDGGVPYHFLKSRFHVQLLGNYLGVGVVGTEGDWKVRSARRTKYYQKDLREAYKKAYDSAKPPPQLPVNLGSYQTLAGVYSSKSKKYVFRRTRAYVGQHLMLASRAK